MVKLSDLVEEREEEDLSIKSLTELLKEINKLRESQMKKQQEVRGYPTIQETNPNTAKSSIQKMEGNPTSGSLPQQEQEPLKKEEKPLNESMKLNINDEKLDNELTIILNAYGENPIASQISISEAIKLLKENKAYRAELLRVVKEAIKRSTV